MTRTLTCERPRRAATAARPAVMALLAVATIASSGCLHWRTRPPGQASLCQDIPAVPVNQLPPEYLGRSKADLIEISFTRLRQTPSETYLLDEGDVLGIYIENVLAGDDAAPPVHFPDDPSQNASIGFPTPIGENGTLSLPLIDDIDVRGLTVLQVRDRIREAYTVDKEILVADEDRILVTLQERRTKRVLVIREEAGDVQDNRSRRRNGNNSNGQAKHGSGYNVDLPAYENDLLHALNETGGLPGLDAENEVLIFKGGRMGGYNHDETVARLLQSVGPCECRPEIPDDPNVIRIPIRFYPDEVPTFTEQDIILEDGDIVYIQSRDNEKFYTGGQVEGGEHDLPRDYDINVLQAIAIAGGDVGGNGGLSQLGQRNNRGGIIPPSRAIVLRNIPCVGEIPIEVNLRQAITDPSQRILIQPGDTILVRYTKCEGVSNAALNLLQFNVLLGSGIN